MSGAAGRAVSGRLVLLSTSPRVAAGLLSWHAWSVLRGGQVVAADGQHPLLVYLRDADIDVEIVTAGSESDLAQMLLDRAAHTEPLVFLLPQVGEDTFARALTTLLVGGPSTPAPEVEILPGSYDLPGARLLDVVATMDRLRSPGGCPWDAEQTHESLMTYLVEETYETIEAIETGDRDHLREELGDLLLQVMFHSRIAAEHAQQPWSVDDVAADLTDKLVRRHPHVFADATAVTAGDVESSWETLKGAEKGRTSAVEGVPMSLPALSLAAKLIHRARSHGVDVRVTDGDDMGSRLMQLVTECDVAGLDAEAELRAAARRYADRVRSAET